MFKKKRTRIMASNSKKRKLGDEVNGWVYSKGYVEKSFGMEIVSYVWKPMKSCIPMCLGAILKQMNRMLLTTPWKYFGRQTFFKLCR